jgi:hypothetical protein
MKFISAISFILLSIFPLHAEKVYIQPKGDYAEIDVNLSQALIEQLSKGILNLENRIILATKVFSSPGLFTPPVLLKAGLCFLENKDYDKAALLCIGGIFRTEIDIRISKDITLQDLPTILGQNLAEEVAELLHSEQEFQMWEMVFLNAIGNFEKWDRITPRSYDKNWVRLHSLHAFNETRFETMSKNDQQKVIEKFYRELRREESEEDFANASNTDLYYFDRQNRIFYHNEGSFSFYVPNNLKPQLDRYGKFMSLLLFPNQGELWINSGWSINQKTFEDAYKTALFYKDPESTITKMEIGKHIPCYRERHLFKDITSQRVSNSFNIANNQFTFEFVFICNLEDEDRFIKEIQPIFDTVKFK